MLSENQAHQSEIAALKVINTKQHTPYPKPQTPKPKLTPTFCASSSNPNPETQATTPRDWYFLPNNQRQQRTSHDPKDVLPLRICGNYCAPQPRKQAAVLQQGKEKAAMEKTILTLHDEQAAVNPKP